MSVHVPAINFEVIEKYDGDKTILDNGVFSAISPNMLPMCYSRHGSEDLTSKGTCLPVAVKNTSRRLIKKSGKPNITRCNNPLKRIAYIRDFGNTLVNSHWKWTLLCFASSYVVCWLVFAVFYMLVARDNSDASSCFAGIFGFAGYFLLSLETQQTIGYGTRYITSNCIEAVFLISLQMVTSIAICGAMTTIVYTKMVRPQKWRTNPLFSKVAVICQRDGELCLIFRLRDDENKYGMGTKITAYLVQTRKNEPRLKSLALEKPGLLLWPLEIIHKITPSSPFWDLSAKDLITYRFELAVMMQGTSVTTGQCSKTRSSYLSTEVLWGHRFKPCVRFDNETEKYIVEHSDFNKTEEVLTPLCSAQRLEEVIGEIASPISTPMYYRSPAISTRFSNLYQDDEESTATSSGIGSMRDEQLSPLAKKLSTIRELNSLEDISAEDPENVRLLNKNGYDHCVCVEPNKSHRVYSDTTQSAVFDVESLVASLQTYLDQNSSSKKNVYNFCETDF